MPTKKKSSTTQAPVDPRVEEAVAQRANGSELPCAVAFDIAKRLDADPATVGAAADHQALKLVKCQLGLFGYAPEKKRVTPVRDAPSELKEAVAAAAAGGRLSCAETWEIAARFDVPKMRISGICEAEGIKIKPCQLGAF